MFNWAQTHGIELLIGYFLAISIFGTMPVPGPDAGYLLRWFFAAGHALSGNLKNVVSLLQPKAVEKLANIEEEKKP